MRSRGRSERADRRALLTGVLCSAVLHGVVLLGGRFHGVDPPSDRPGARAAASPNAIEVVTIAAAATADAGRAPRRDVVSPEPALARSTPSRFRTAELREPPDRRDHATPDHRLWRESSAGIAGPTDPVAALRARIVAGAQGYHDSLAVARAAEDAITDISVRGPDGGRWGASTGRLHVGERTLPYCGGTHSVLDCGFGVSPGRADEFEARLRTFREIEDQAARVAADAILADRIRRMRERSNAIRDSLRSSGRSRSP